MARAWSCSMGFLALGKLDGDMFARGGLVETKSTYLIGETCSDHVIPISVMEKILKPFEQRGFAITKRAPRNAALAEIGVLIGQTSEFILRTRKDVSLLMIDSWLTADKQPERYKATGDDHALHADPARVKSHRSQAEARAKLFPGRATIMPLTSSEAAAKVVDGSLDLVFIDADHSKEGVTEDISLWLPKVKAGGWIGGHDYRNPDPRFRFGVTEAVDEWAAAAGRPIETDLNFTWFARA